MPNNIRPEQGLKLARLERKRKRLGVSLEFLASRSGIHPRRLTRIRRDQRCSGADMRALTFALRAIERQVPDELAAFAPGRSNLEAAAGVAFKGLLASVHLSVPPEQAKKVALYLLVTCCNVPSTTAGRVYGCTKQYVSKAIRQVEDLREDPIIGPALREIEAKLV